MSGGVRRTVVTHESVLQNLEGENRDAFDGWLQRKVLWRPRAFKIKCSEDTYNEETRLKYTLQTCEEIDYATDGTVRLLSRGCCRATSCAAEWPESMLPQSRRVLAMPRTAPWLCTGCAAVAWCLCVYAWCSMSMRRCTYHCSCYCLMGSFSGLWGCRCFVWTRAGLLWRPVCRPRSAVAECDHRCCVHGRRH